MTSRLKTPRTKPREPEPLIGFVLTGAASALLTCLFMLVAALVYRLADTGSAADWIISVANTVMAATAIAAFLVARSWLPQMTTQEGYKLAIELVNDHYLWLGQQNSLLESADRVLMLIRHRQDGKPMPGPAVSEAEVLESLLQTLQEHKTRRDTMQQIRFRLGTYGLHEAYPVRDRFQGLNDAYQETCGAADALGKIVAEMNELLKLVPHYKPGSGMMHLEPIDEKLLGWRNVAEKIDIRMREQHAHMLQIHHDLFGSNPAIGNLFKVRK